ncbi:dTDP-4-dehydrorhamnose 3,5-epimerase [Aquirufa sp. HETE-83D]|uniref:dTDP-4-dehydrorhamnose 3,5-epimerase n=1 Tax=Aquirufa esocilacus TaxID=3096513 RepID=A0ABW6DIV7_9BACT
MKLELTHLQDCFIIKEDVFEDSRGYFMETFNQKQFNALTNLDLEFVQDNQSRSSKGVLRGLHFQIGESAQAKLVRVLEGAVLDVAVDLRKDSPSFGRHIEIELTSDNHKQLFIPAGFAHGFVVLSDFATFFYKVDKYYHPGNESGIVYNDIDLNIDWKIPVHNLKLSEKDKSLGTFKDLLNSM